MILERIKSEGLAHNSYLIGSGDTAAVIDPRRDCQIYLYLAQKHSLKITHILETHRNEDYAIGSIELQSLTRAQIYHGPGLTWGYGDTLKEGQKFRFGKLELTALHTPGHTDESMSYSVVDLACGQSPVLVFSGDTLFVNDVGRIDLYGKEEAPRLASALYHSIFKKLLPLGDGVILCPAHGAGSVCGANIADRDDSTLGTERLQNPVLQRKNRDDFIAFKLAEKLERPHYFLQMEKYNLAGPPLLGRFPQPVVLTPAEFKIQMEKGAQVVDTSEAVSFGGAHIKNSYNIWLGGLPVFAGWLLSYEKPILLVLEEQAHLDRAIHYLIRIGYDLITGYLKDGIQGWYGTGMPAESLPLISIHRLKQKLENKEELLVLDTRSQAEWDKGHIAGALHIYVGHLESRLDEIPRDKPIAALCETGNRASIATSILLRAGYSEVSNVPGGMGAWTAAGFPIMKD